jgi:hypothetical protein
MSVLLAKKLVGRHESRKGTTGRSRLHSGLPKRPLECVGFTGRGKTRSGAVLKGHGFIRAANCPGMTAALAAGG